MQCSSLAEKETEAGWLGVIENTRIGVGFLTSISAERFRRLGVVVLVRRLGGFGFCPFREQAEFSFDSSVHHPPCRR